MEENPERAPGMAYCGKARRSISPETWSEAVSIAGIIYRSLHSWKYELLAPYEHLLPPALCQLGRYIETAYLVLAEDAVTVKARYAWDGASGPTLDTPNTMRGSLVHDALYQLIRLGALPLEAKGPADDELIRICREDGMSAFRARLWHRFVSWFGHPKESTSC